MRQNNRVRACRWRTQKPSAKMHFAQLHRDAPGQGWCSDNMHLWQIKSINIGGICDGQWRTFSLCARGRGDNFSLCMQQRHVIYSLGRRCFLRQPISWVWGKKAREKPATHRECLIEANLSQNIKSYTIIFESWNAKSFTTETAKTSDTRTKHSNSRQRHGSMSIDLDGARVKACWPLGDQVRATLNKLCTIRAIRRAAIQEHHKNLAQAKKFHKETAQKKPEQTVYLNSLTRLRRQVTKIPNRSFIIHKMFGLCNEPHKNTHSPPLNKLSSPKRRARAHTRLAITKS